MKKKILLMGKSQSGKTSMRSVVFANYVARDTWVLSSTVYIEQSHVNFLGALILNIWDCGGEPSFMNNYMMTQRDNMFHNVEVLVYVFAVDTNDIKTDMNYFKLSLKAIQQRSPNAKIFCLIHKMDLNVDGEWSHMLPQFKSSIQQISHPMKVTIFETSIYNETIYRAWAQVINGLIPNLARLQTFIRKFAEIIKADEVAVFEKATFLTVTSHVCKEHKDLNRFEKVTNIMKQFKLSCSKSASSFVSLEIQQSKLTVFIDSITTNLFVIICISDPTVTSKNVNINIKVARKQLENAEYLLTSLTPQTATPPSPPLLLPPPISLSLPPAPKQITPSPKHRDISQTSTPLPLKPLLAPLPSLPEPIKSSSQSPSSTRPKQRHISFAKKLTENI